MTTEAITTTQDKKWAVVNDTFYFPVSRTTHPLPPGFYGYHSMPPAMFKRKAAHDRIISTGLAAEIAQDLDKFLANHETYEKLGFIHKRGALLIGYPGVGKSMTAWLVGEHIVKIGGVVLLPPVGDYNALRTMVSMVREVHPNMPILNVMEDIEKWFERDDDNLLYFLDGADQTNAIIHMATTNYPEKLDARLLNRPGRFDLVRWVEPPDAKVRQEYFWQVLPKGPASFINELVEESEGLLLSHLRALVCATMVMGQPVKQAADDLKAMTARSNENDRLRKAAEALEAKLPPSLAKQLRQMRESIEAATAA